MNQGRKNQSPDVLAEIELDSLFQQAQEDAPTPLPEPFQARLLADALSAQPGAAPQRVWSRLVGWLGEFGGVPGVAGVAAAGVAGVWIGFSGPGLTGDLVTEFWQGAATVSPTVSSWVEDGPLVVAGSDLLSLMNDEAE